MSVIFTIGHSNHDIDDIRSAMREFGVRAIVDVRSQPYSKYSPHFNRPELSTSLKHSGFDYAFMGRELGGRPEERSFYDDKGFVRYDLWSQSPLFQDGLRRLLKTSEKREVALLCSEEDPAVCHRHLLIARALVDKGFPGREILHIRANGRHVTDEELPRQGGLFGRGTEWRSPQSVLHKVQRSTSSNASGGLEYDD